MRAGARSLQLAGFLDSAQELLDACRCLLLLRLLRSHGLPAGSSVSAHPEVQGSA